MNFKLTSQYLKDLQTSYEGIKDFSKLKNSSILITGATGLIGSYLADLFIFANQHYDMNINVWCMGRSRDKIEKRFEYCRKEECFHIYEGDVKNPIDVDVDFDYIIHAAGNAHPSAFVNHPVDTLLAGIEGTKNLISYGLKHNLKRFLFVSSGEIYGDPFQNCEIKEDSKGYIDCQTVRASYPESKRVGECLCAAYGKEASLDYVITRLCHTYGPNFTDSDSRANAQFISMGLRGENIVLNSAGSQLRTYCYIADCAMGVITALLNGNTGEAYNVSNNDAQVTIADFAVIVAKKCNTKVIFSTTQDDKKYQTPVKNAVIDSSKLMKLGYQPQFSVEKGIENTLKICRDFLR